jgi:hypothetical protein
MAFQPTTDYIQRLVPQVKEVKPDDTATARSDRQAQLQSSLVNLERWVSDVETFRTTKDMRQTTHTLKADVERRREIAESKLREAVAAVDAYNDASKKLHARAAVDTLDRIKSDIDGLLHLHTHTQRVLDPAGTKRPSSNV